MLEIISRKSLLLKEIPRDYTSDIVKDEDIVQTTKELVGYRSGQTMLEPFSNLEGAKFDYTLEHRVGSLLPRGENMKNVSIISEKPHLKNCVICCICRFEGKDINSHVHRVHKMSCSEYKSLFPKSNLVCEGTIRTRAEKSSISVRKFWNSSVGKKVMINANRNRIETNVERYNNPFPNQKKAQDVSRELWKNLEWKNEQMKRQGEGMMKKYGTDNCFNGDSPFRQKVDERRGEVLMEKYGVNNVGKLPWVQIKIRKSSDIKPNRAEDLLNTITPKFVKYVGDGTFWIKWLDGTPKNPDFVVRPFRKWKSVVELFGEFYHIPEEEKLYIDEYAKVGVRCLVIWCKELYSSKKNMGQLQDKIKQFLNEGSSETVRQTPLNGDDTVQTTF